MPSHLLSTAIVPNPAIVPFSAHTPAASQPGAHLRPGHGAPRAARGFLLVLFLGLLCCGLFLAPRASAVIPIPGLAQDLSAAAPVSGGDNNTRLLWASSNGTLTLWNTDQNGAILSHVSFGPYASYTPTHCAVGPDGRVHVLWVKTDGSISLFSIDMTAATFTYYAYGPYSGATAIGLAVGPDNKTRVLWNNTSGAIDLWDQDSSTGNFTVNAYGPYTGSVAKAVAVGQDNYTRIIWSQPNGALALWKVTDSTGAFTVTAYSGGNSGWTPQFVSVGLDNLPRVLWTNTDGTQSLWTINEATGATVQNNYSIDPSTGWSPKNISVSPSDGRTRILWSNGDGRASLWSVDTSTGNFTQTVFPSVTGLSVPSPVVAGQSTTATVTLNVGGPPAGTVVTLSSSNPGAASVPATMTIPGGSDTGTFSVTAGSVTSPTPVTISATNALTQTATLTVNPVPPAAPTGLSASAASAAQITLSWTAPSGTGLTYKVYRGTAAGGEAATPIATGVASVTYSDATVSAGTAYYYKVAAVNAGGTGAQSGEASATPLSAPGNLSAVGGTGQVSLSWTASAGAVSYNVKRGTTSGGPYTTISTAGQVTGTTYVDTTAANGTPYYYVVKAVNANASSVNSLQAGATPLAAPATPAATPGNGQVSLTWASVAGATGYNVYQGTSAGAESATPLNASPLTTTNYIAGSLTNGQPYFYTVKAVNSSGSSIASGEASATPQVPAPSAPANLSAALVNGQVSLSWTASAGAVSYNVKRSATSGGPYTTVSTAGQVTGTTYTDASASNGTLSYYVVTAVNPGGESGPSNQAGATPLAAPAAPAATSGNGTVALSWASVPGATGYNVYRGTSTGNESATPLNASPQAATSYSDPGLTNGQAYFYTVKAVNGNGLSAASGEASATPQVPAPAAPTNPAASAGNAQVTVTWTPPTGPVSSYNLYRSTTAGGEGTQPYQTGITGASYPDTALTNGTTYYYKVAAVNAGGAGPQSVEAGATPQAPPLAPTGLAAAPGNAQVTLSWTASAGTNLTYNVKRGTTSGGPYAVIATGQTGTVYTDNTGLANGTNYVYVVTAVGVGGESGNSNEAAATPVAPPSAPASPAAAPGNARITVSWAASAGATSYNLYRSLTSNGEGGTAYQTGVTSPFVDTGLTNGTTYFYQVTAANASGESAKSLEVSAAPVAPPSAPSSLSATAGNGQVSLTWIAPTGMNLTYNVYRGTAANGEGVSALITGLTSPAYPDMTVANGTIYYYKVTAVNAGGESGLSNEASAAPVAAPSAPTNLAATPGNSQVSLSWAAPVGAGLTYNLYRGTASGAEGATAIASGLTTTRYTDNNGGGGLTNGQTYFYTVKAVNTSGSSPASGEASAAPDSTILPATNLAATAQNQYVSLQWNPIAGASSYNLYRSTTSGGEGAVPIATNVNGTTSGGLLSYNDGYNSGTGTGTLSNGTTYYYQIVPVGSTGTGTLSNEASATPGVTPMAAPLLKAVAGNTQVTLTWSAITGATSYNLYRGIGNSGSYQLYQLALASPTFVDTGLTNGTSYSYYVAAVDADGQGSTTGGYYGVSATPGATALPPAKLVANAQNGYVSLQWTAVSNASSYNLYRSTTSGGEGAAPFATGINSSPNGGTVSYNDGYNSNTGTGNLTNGTTYYYQVAPVSSVGEGTFSNEASAAPGASPLSAPVLKAIAGNGQVALTWSNVPGATTYNIYRSASNPYGAALYQTGLTSATYTDSSVTNSTTYFYYVAAVNVSGQGNTSNYVSATPGSASVPATVLSATAGSGQITLTWAPVAGVSSYNLYRSTTAGGEGAVPYLINLPSNSTSYGDTNLPNGTTYYYQVAPVSSDGEGLLSNEASATPGSGPLTAPTNLTATAAPNNGASITLNWTAVPGTNITYNVYRSTYGGYGSTLYHTGITGASYVDAGVVYGPTYTYTITAVSKDGEGTHSTSASATLYGFGLSASPASVAVARGAVQTVNILATPSGGYTGQVTLSGSNLPAGVTAWFYPATVTLPTVNSPEYQAGLPSEGIGGQVSSGLYFAVSAGATPGTYTVHITGTSGSFIGGTDVVLTIN